jgi:hypothetical protein
MATGSQLGHRALMSAASSSSVTASLGGSSGGLASGPVSSITCAKASSSSTPSSGGSSRSRGMVRDISALRLRSRRSVTSNGVDLRRDADVRMSEYVRHILDIRARLEQERSQRDVTRHEGYDQHGFADRRPQSVPRGTRETGETDRRFLELEGKSQVKRGALGGTRTPNLLIRSQMLYPLSYERGSLDVHLLSCRHQRGYQTRA